MLFVSAFQARAGDYLKDRELYESKCMGCHTMDTLLWPRSYKAWQLIVVRMRAYTFDGSEFTEAETERIARFLAAYGGEGVLLNADGKPPETEEYAEAEPAPPPPVEVVIEKTEPAKTVEQVVQKKKVETVEATKKAAVTEKAETVSYVPERKFWNPSRNALFGARVSGFVAVACLIGLLITGLMSRRLEGGLRKIHALLALGLFLSLATHGLINIVEYGTPNVLWYWFGLVGFLALAVTQFQGILRKRFHKGLLMWHATGACFGLLLSILHWVWAWL